MVSEGYLATQTFNLDHLGLHLRAKAVQDSRGSPKSPPSPNSLKPSSPKSEPFPLNRVTESDPEPNFNSSTPFSSPIAVTFSPNKSTPTSPIWIFFSAAESGVFEARQRLRCRIEPESDDGDAIQTKRKKDEEMLELQRLKNRVIAFYPCKAEKYSSTVHEVLKELAKGVSEPVLETSSKYGSAYVSSPVFFVLERLLIVVQWWLERDSNVVQFSGGCSLLDKRRF
ncbi:hypothetical protein ACLB2K_028477 [Fragaria x ananassa]